MSHLALGKPDGKRISLQTLYVTPNAPLTVGVWGWIPGLKLVGYYDSNKGDIGREVTAAECEPRTADGATAKFVFKKTNFYRLELKMGEAVWDWCRVDCDPKNRVAPKEAMGTGTLNIELLWSKQPKPGKNPISWYVTVADLLLQKHGFKLNVVGSTEYTPGRALAFGEDVVVQQYVGNIPGLTAAVAKRPEYSKPNSVVVVCGPARQHIDEGKDFEPFQGQHIGKGDENYGRPYALINTDERSPDGATLLHEVIHCAGGQHNKRCRDVIDYGYRRNGLNSEIVGHLQRAFFRTA